MKELAEYRINLINRLVAASHDFRTECMAVRDAFKPLETGGWNIHQLAAHTRAVDSLVYGLRVRRTAAETNPEFENFDGEAYMVANYNPQEPLQQILNGFVAEVESLAGMLRELPTEAWSRVSSHVMLGRGITLQAWVEKDLAHIEEHLRTARQHNQ